MKKLRLVALLLLTLFSASAKPKKQLKAGDKTPSFQIADVNGSIISSDGLIGKKVLITFYRSVGCPVCNLYFHQIQEQTEIFRQKGITVISVYESPATAIKQYIAGENFYSIMIPDSTEQLYNLYQLKLSWWKTFKSPFTGVFTKSKKGKQLFREKTKYDAHRNRIGADFLIDENGKIIFAYYGKYIGDHISVTEIIKYLP